MNQLEDTQAKRFKYMRTDIIACSQQSLAEILHVPYQVIGFIESGRKQKIDTEILKILMTECNINIEWLLFGFGNPSKVDDALQRMEDFENIAAVPFVNAKAAAGAGEAAPDYEEKDLMYFDKRWLENVIGVNSKNLSIIQAKGNSMQPTINDGDLLLIDNSDKLGCNGIYVFRQDNSDLRVKRLQKDFNGNLQIISDNSEYPVEVLDNTTTDFFIDIIGKVVWNGSREGV